MSGKIIRAMRRVFPFITERAPIFSVKNPCLMIEQDGIWGRHVSSGGAFQSGNYPEGMWNKVFCSVLLKEIKPHSILILGSGAGSSFFVLQDILKKEKLSCVLEGVERDPVMTCVGRLMYGDTFSEKIKNMRIEELTNEPLDDTDTYHAGNITVVHCDARDFFSGNRRKYSMIVIDLFHCFEVIPLVFEPSFIQNVYAHLEPNGHIIINAFNASARAIQQWEKYAAPGLKLEKIIFRKNTALWMHN